MAIQLEAYTVDGLLTGGVVAEGRLVDLLGGSAAVTISDAAYLPLNGPPNTEPGASSVALDDLVGVVGPADTVVPFHAVWHPLTLDIGPYRIRGELPAMPGFDPARALARPTGMFVLLARVSVELRSEGVNGGSNEHPFLWVNRYAVDGVGSDLELGFFFPGATGTQARHAIA